MFLCVCVCASVSGSSSSGPQNSSHRSLTVSLTLQQDTGYCSDDVTDSNRRRRARSERNLKLDQQLSVSQLITDLKTDHGSDSQQVLVLLEASGGLQFSR